MKAKIVFDTNIFIAAAISPGGFADQLLDRAARGDFQLYVSAAILDELRGKLAGKLSMSQTQITSVIDKILAVSSLVYPTKQIKAPKLRDQQDLHILACAVESAANLIVTSDKDLLALKEFAHIKLAHPSRMKFWYHPNET